MKQKTFHPLTAAFVGAVIKMLPTYIPAEHMQTWIENPGWLRDMLKQALDHDIVSIHENDKGHDGKLIMRITKAGDSPFHKQTAKFIAVVIENIPEISNNRMEMWMKHENTLQEELRRNLIQGLVFAKN